ncbi:hypothetical protein Emed_002849 [Eimeria media]
MDRAPFGSCVAAEHAGAPRAAVFSRFFSDTCLSAAHIPPPAISSSGNLEGPLEEGGRPDLLGALDLLGAPRPHPHHRLPHEQLLLPPFAAPRKRKGAAPLGGRQRLVSCCLPPGSYPQHAAHPHFSCEQEQFAACGYKGAPNVHQASPAAGGGPSPSVCREDHNPRSKERQQRLHTKGGLLLTPHLLQLPILAPAKTGAAASCSSNSSSKSRRKAQVLSPACSLLDVSSSPLSVVSQASTTCALLSSASSLDGCSQPATPYCGLLDYNAGASLPPAVPSAPAASPSEAHKAAVTTAATAAAATAAAAAAAAAAASDMQQDGCSPQASLSMLRKGSGADQSLQPEQQQPQEAFSAATAPPPAAAAAAGGTVQAAAAAIDSSPAGCKGLLPPTAGAASVSDESTAATCFLSSPKAAAAPSPLRLPIPARGLRRLQHPRLQPQQQQQQAAATAEGAEPPTGNASNTQNNPTRSLRRLQLPRLRSPLGSLDSSAACMLRGKEADRGLCSKWQQQRQLVGPPHLASADAQAVPPCTHISALTEEAYPHRSAGGESLCCGGSCSQGAPRPGGGGPLGDAFEAAAHAAHVAAHAAARAAAHAAAHAAVLKRRAAEAYWFSRSAPRAAISIYPDLDRDINDDYNLYCAAWPDAIETPGGLPAGSQSEEQQLMAVDGPPTLPQIVPKTGKAAKGHLVLGEGRYGKVVLAEHKRTHEMVAIKMLDKRRALADDTWDCRQELEMHRRLPHHPHVVSVLDVYEDRKSLYILMELCDRNTLVDRIVSDGAFTEEQAKLIFAQLLSGVMHCHNNNIVHRDLKPENILFAREPDTHKFPRPDYWSRRRSSGDRSYPPFSASHDSSLSSSSCARGATSTVKITDFGSACYAVPGELSGTACGTIHYLAPEVLAGNYYDGFLSDVWSLGVILYIIISATPPFYGESDGEVVQKIVAGSYSMNGYPWRHVSDDCKDIIRRLLTVDPRCRMCLNEAISHPWFVRATGGVGCSLPLLSCHRCPSEDSVYEKEGDGKLLDEELEGPCCCGSCHVDHCEAAAAASSPLVLSPPFRFSCCPSSVGADHWVAAAHQSGFLDFPRN